MRYTRRMTEPADAPVPPVSPDAVAFEAGDVRVTVDAVHLGEGHAPLALADIVAVEETSSPKSPAQIAAMIGGGLLLFVAVPSAMMCPLALIGIPIAAKVLSWALRDRETSFALRVQLATGASVVALYDERWVGARVERELTRVIEARARVRS